MAQEKPDSTPLKPSGAADFKKKSAERDHSVPLELPSGLVVELKRPSVRAMIAKGYVPDSIAQQIVNSQQTQGGTVKFNKDQFAESIQLQEIVAVQAVTKPEVLPEGEDPDYEKNQISVKDLDDQDLDAIFLHVTKGARPDAVDSFRGEPTGVPS